MTSIFPGPTFAFLGLLAAIGLAFVCWGVGLARVLVTAWRRQWGRLAALVPVYAISFPLTLAGLWSGDYLHLALFYPAYARAIGEHPGDQARFDWGDSALMVIDGLRSRTLRLRRDPGLSEPGWNGAEPRGVSYIAHHLVGSFFLEQTQYP